MGIYFLSFANNLVANVVSLKHLGDSIMTRLETFDRVGLHYDIARLARVLTTFKMIDQ